MKRKKPPKISFQERLRQIAWEVGHGYPIPLAADYVALSMVHPRLGHVHWHVGEGPVQAFGDGRIVVRIFDVTDILFDGFNAHAFFDIVAGGPAGCSFFRVERLGRNYLAEVGLRNAAGCFRPLARSEATYFDRDQPSRNWQHTGLFVWDAFGLTFPVENIFDAPVYEGMNRELETAGNRSLSAAVVFIDISPDINRDGPGPLSAFIENCALQIRRFGGKVQFFPPGFGGGKSVLKKGSLTKSISDFSPAVLRSLKAAHAKSRFQVIHCHDWYSSAVGLSAAKKLKLPMILSLHSTEHERTGGGRMNRLSLAIREWERMAVHGAALVVVPSSSTRQQVVDLYNGDPERVVTIPDALEETASGAPSDPTRLRRCLGFPEDAPLVLFAGEISYSAGADLFIDALPVVCRNHGTARFVIAGEGPLRWELEGRVRDAGIGHRCRFLGHVDSAGFDSVLAAADFVVIPARAARNDGLAQTAIHCGKPVLTTHQAGIRCVTHGETGLVTFDNPASIAWGVQELLFNPLPGMAHRAAKRRASRVLSLESIAARYYTCYHQVARQSPIHRFGRVTDA